MDRVRWARLIARRRAQSVQWQQIADETGLSVDQCQRLHNQLLRAGDPDAPRDAWEWVFERRDALDAVMEEAARTYEAAPEGSAAAIGALKLFNQASAEKLELARMVGWTPRRLGALNAERAMQEMFRRLAEVAEEHDAPDELVRAFLDLAERQITGMQVIEAREAD